MDVTRALQRAVRAYPHGTDSLAAALGMSATTLSHKVSPSYPTQFMSPEGMLELMEVTGDDGALQALAQARGYVLLPMPGGAGAEGECPQQLLAAVHRFSEHTRQVSQAVSPTSPGGEAVTGNELAEIEASATEAISAIQRIVVWAQARHGESVPVALREVPHATAR